MQEGWEGCRQGGGRREREREREGERGIMQFT